MRDLNIPHAPNLLPATGITLAYRKAARGRGEEGFCR